MLVIMFFFFNDTATTEIYTLSLHDALPISPGCGSDRSGRRCRSRPDTPAFRSPRTRRGRRVRARGRRDTVEPCLRAPQSALPAAARAGSSENRTVCGGVTPPGLLTTDHAGSHPEGWGVTLLSHSDCSTACWTHRATHRASYVAPRWRARRGPACLATA